jgi:hypothetical protein
MKVCGREVKVSGRLIRTARLDADKYEFLNDPETLLDGLRKCGKRIDLFTFMQVMPQTDKKFDYPMEMDNLAVLPVSTFDHWWNHQIRSYPRNRARQAEKRGVKFRELAFNDSLVEGIWKIYNETPIRQGKKFPHYGKSREQVRNESATYLDSSYFVGAFFGEELIGFAKMTTDQKGQQANLMNILSMAQHRDKAPTNALVAQSVKLCAEKKIAYLVYQSYSYANKAPDTLAKFKDNNGFQRVDLPRYYVPLTAVGRAALRFGLHHKLIDLFPEPLTDKLRELRTAWYNRKSQSAETAPMTETT